MYLRFRLMQARVVVPTPMKGSKTTSPSLVKSLMNQVGKAMGNAALWLRFEHSVAKCRTFVGYARLLPSQFETFFPKPLPTLDTSRSQSVWLNRDNLLFFHLPIGTITSSWIILHFFCLLNCRQRSHDSRQRLVHLP